MLKPFVSEFWAMANGRRVLVKTMKHVATSADSFREMLATNPPPPFDGVDPDSKILVITRPLQSALQLN